MDRYVKFGKLKDGDAFYLDRQVWIKAVEWDEWEMKNIYYARKFDSEEQAFFSYDTLVERM